MVFGHLLAQQHRRKNRTEQRTRGEQRLGDRRTVERIVGEGLQKVIQERLAEARDEEQRQVSPLESLQAEQGVLAAYKTDDQHQQYRRYKAQNNHRERRQNG